MFALLNPPLKNRKKAAYGAGGNPWFGEPARHAAAAKKGWAVRRRKHGKRLKHAKSLRTPGGGRIFAIAANRPRSKSRRTRYNSFMGINAPNSNTHPTLGVALMAKRRRGGSRRSRYNGSRMISKVKNSAIGVLPILGGVIANGFITSKLSEHIPYTRKGIGNIALGLIDAGLIGLAASYIPGVRGMGNQAFIGGVVGTLGCAFQNLMSGGFGAAFGLGDDLDGFGNINPNPYTAYSFQGMGGMGNFTSPGAIASAISSESTMGQNSLPASNAQFIPMAPPQTPAQAHGARHMADYEGSAVGAMLGQDDGMTM